MKHKLLFFLLFCSLFSVDSFSQDDYWNNGMLKGMSNISFRVGLEGGRKSNDVLLSILDIEESNTFETDLALGGGWFIADNVALNGRISYSFSDKRNTVEAKILELVLDASKYNTNTVSSSFSTAVGVKNYIPVGYSKRFFLFNESNVCYIHTEELTRDVYNDGDKIRKIQRVENSFNIGLAPGFMYFLTKGFAFEFSMNPIMLSLTHEDILTDETVEGENLSYSLDFKLNPFNIYFGFSYFFSNGSKIK